MSLKKFASGEMLLSYQNSFRTSESSGFSVKLEGMLSCSVSNMIYIILILNNENMLLPCI